ncbi:MAG: cytochrome c-type biogenesis protein [Bellilinea sp.]
MYKNSTFIIIALFLGLVLIGLTSVSVYAQSPTPSDDDVNEIAKQLYCPVCENIPLDVCPTQACAQWRDLIREKLAAGWDEKQIRAYFAAQYGDRVLDQPPTRGLNLMVYTLPPLFFLVGAYLVYRVLKSSRKKTPRPSTQPPSTPQEFDPYISRLETELEQRQKNGE